MLEIASTQSYVDFNDIKGCDSMKKMWDTLCTIFVGDTNVLRAKSESLRGKFDDMRMQEGENVAQYCSRIKHCWKKMINYVLHFMLQKMLYHFHSMYVEFTQALKIVSRVCRAFQSFRISKDNVYQVYIGNKVKFVEVDC